MRKTLGALAPAWRRAVVDCELEQALYSTCKTYGFLSIRIKNKGL